MNGIDEREGLRSRTRSGGRLGWIATEAVGAFRGSRLAVVVATAILAVGLAATAWSSGPVERAGFALEGTEVGGPATIVVSIDTRGAPLRIDAPTELGLPNQQGTVGPNEDLTLFINAVRTPLRVRLEDPHGVVVVRQVVAPSEHSQVARVLDEQGMWRLELATADVRGLILSLHGSFVAEQSILEREGGLQVLAMMGLAIAALLAAPFRRLGAAIVGLALLPLGLFAAYGVAAGRFQPRLGALVTGAAIVAVAAGSGLGSGWSWHRRRERKGLRGFGVGLCIVAAIALLASSFGALGGIGRSIAYLVGSVEEYGAAIALFVFACATGLGWLGALLIGLGTAPRRGGPPAEGDALTRASPHRRERVTTIGSGRGAGRG
jgi:hypothetical protein